MTKPKSKYERKDGEQLNIKIPVPLLPSPQKGKMTDLESQIQEIIVNSKSQDITNKSNEKLAND